MKIFNKILVLKITITTADYLKIELSVIKDNSSIILNRIIILTNWPPWQFRILGNPTTNHDHKFGHPRVNQTELHYHTPAIKQSAVKTTKSEPTQWQ
ncbi:MAG: hypothetical protein KUG78_12420 [Kangiellaceae bacterium]|nr:hypothetical protein [Kangiellaceae bacterium]